MRDEELIRLLHKKPYEGMKALTQQYSGLLCAVVGSKLSKSVYNSAEIEDCVANTFSEFYINIDKFNPKESSLKSWLCVLARNNAIDVLRKDKAVKISMDDKNTFARIEDGSSLEIDIEDKALRKQVLNEVKNLGEPDRTIIIKKYYFNKSSKEIANELGMTVSNVDTRTHRAISKLKKIFGGEDV